MDSSTILEYTAKTLIIVLKLSMLPIIVATSIGLIVSLLQALTQIQEQTLSFAIKLVAISLTLLMAARWIGGELLALAQHIFTRFPWIVQ